MALAFKARKTRTGVFHPLKIEKYLGNKLPVYRSSYERAFFRFCDQNPNVLKWGSETIRIPYLNPIDRKVHSFIVDNFLLLKNGAGMPQKYLVEIKPFSQTRKPEAKKRKRKKTLLFEQLQFAENAAKWSAAEQWCKKNDCKFMVLTENELFNKK